MRGQDPDPDLGGRATTEELTEAVAAVLG